MSSGSVNLMRQVEMNIPYRQRFISTDGYWHALLQDISQIEESAKYWVTVLRTYHRIYILFTTLKSP